MKKAVVKIDKDYKLGTLRDRVFSSFVEHMGSCVYNGIYEPDHPCADEKGLRKDVLQLVKELRLPAVRYPGGNFSSGYNWEDTVGSNRPHTLEIAWKQIEPNTFGLHEFIDWLGMAGAEPIMTVNLGTHGPDQARHLLEYCNFPGGTLYSDKRRKNGAENPFDIRTWCLGNELDGTWQIGHKTAREYGRLAAETARVMRMIDRDLELIAVGSSHNKMPSFPEWDRTMLMECYDDVDYIALHKYINNMERDTAAYLASPLEMESQIRDIIATCDYVRSVKRSKKTMLLSFDEWNVAPYPSTPEPKPDWQIGPDRDKTLYRFEDALVFASMLLTLIRNADRVHIACQAILVNVLPMVVANKGGKAWRNSIYYPFLHASLYGRGEVLHVLADVPRYDCREFTDVPVLDTAAVYNMEESTVTFFVVNRGDQEQVLELNLNGFGEIVGIHHIKYACDLQAVNTETDPNACIPCMEEQKEFSGRVATVSLSAYSWNVVRVRVKG